MSRCFVPGCKTGWQSSQGKNLFKAPSAPDELEKWRFAIPSGDRVLTDKDFVCELHFAPQYILRAYTVETDESTVPRGHCALVNGAVPNIFHDLPSNVSKRVLHKKQPLYREVNSLSKSVRGLNLRKVCPRDVNHLKFSNPGRFMEDFDPEQSKREMRKVHRRFYRESHRANRVYNNDGIRLADHADVCDCLAVDCPGCHFPCPRCSSPKCGHECRANRCWFYTEVEMEGSRTKILSDFLRKAKNYSKPSTDARV